MKLRKWFAFNDRLRRIQDRIGAREVALVLARPFGLTDRGRFDEQWIRRNHERVARVVGHV